MSLKSFDDFCARMVNNDPVSAPEHDTVTAHETRVMAVRDNIGDKPYHNGVRPAMVRKLGALDGVFRGCGAFVLDGGEHQAWIAVRLARHNADRLADRFSFRGGSFHSDSDTHR